MMSLADSMATAWWAHTPSILCRLVFVDNTERQLVEELVLVVYAQEQELAQIQRGVAVRFELAILVLSVPRLVGIELE